MRLIATTLFVVTAALGGCATAPLPDGGKISRLPEPGTPLAMSLEERKRYDEVDKQVLHEQQAARAAEQKLEEQARIDARRHVVPYWGIYYGHGWPVWGGYYGPGRWHPHAHWRPRWGVDLYIGP